MKHLFAVLALALLTCSVLLTPAVCRSAQDLPAGFVDVRDVIPSVVLDIRYFSAHNFVGTRVDGYNAPKCILTRQAAEALAGVQKDLEPFSLSLKIYDCYRPQSAVDHFCRWAEDVSDTKMKKEFYPSVEKSNLFRDGYIARKSSHTRGSTVDLTIVALPLREQEQFTRGQQLFECHLPESLRFRDNSIDMGTGFDCFHELSYPENRQVGLEQRVHRLLLKSLMEKHGFAFYDKEWWHFTLKGEPFPDRFFNFSVE